jgi:outer membrane lipoprotein SlyB
MRTALKVGTLVAVLSAVPFMTAEAGKKEGVAIGAGVGAVVAGPVGAVVGGVVGYKVGGPNIITKPRRKCWRDDWGHRHCVWR